MSKKISFGSAIYALVIFTTVACSSNSNTQSETKSYPAYNQNTERVIAGQSNTTVDNLPVNSRLFNAASSGNTSEAISLINQGADVNTKAADMRTPLFDAVREGQLEMVRVLLDRGADVNARHNTGVTPLMWAVMGKTASSTEIVKELLAKGADVRAKDNDGDTVSKWARKYKHKDIIKLIQEAEIASSKNPLPPTPSIPSTPLETMLKRPSSNKACGAIFMPPPKYLALAMHRLATVS